MVWLCNGVNDQVYTDRNLSFFYRRTAFNQCSTTVGNSIGTGLVGEKVTFD